MIVITVKEGRREGEGREGGREGKNISELHESI